MGLVKDPAAVLDYGWDWSQWLAEGDVITDHAVTAPEGLTVESHEATPTTVTAWLSGGTPGQVYSVVCHIVTAQGRTDERTLTLPVLDR